MKHVRFDEFVRAHLKGAADEPPTPECLDPIAVLALLHRPEEVRKEDVQHLLTCRRCQWLVNVAQRSPIPAPRPRSIPQRLFGSIPRFVGTVAVTAAAVFVALVIRAQFEPQTRQEISLAVDCQFNQFDLFKPPEFRSRASSQALGDFFVGVEVDRPVYVHVVAIRESGASELLTIPQTGTDVAFVEYADRRQFGPFTRKRQPTESPIYRIVVVGALHAIPGQVRQALPPKIGSDMGVSVDAMARTLAQRLDSAAMSCGVPNVSSQPGSP